MTITLRRSLLVTLLAALLGTGLAWGQLPGQMFGQIFDENEEPLPGVAIVITDPERPDFKQEEKSDKRGRYRIRLTNATVPYDFSFAKDGYVTFALSRVRVPARQETRRNFTMKSLEAAAVEAEASGDVDVEAAARGGAINVYNEGVKALNAGDAEAAKGLFMTALERKADLASAKAALARVHLELEEYEQAVKWAEEALAQEAEVESMNQVLYASYSALGDNKKAKEALAVLKEADPEKASLNMFNEAADLYNSGKMPEAVAAFEAILETAPDHPKSHYMLGLCYVNTGENDKAKEHFGRFLELAPDDPDASTAKEMIDYLQ